MKYATLAPILTLMMQKGLLDIFALAAFFGPSFLFNKIAVQHIEPITLVALRVGLGGFLLWLVLKYKKIPLPRSLAHWKQGFILGFFLNGLPFVLFCYSLQLIPSSLSALINGLTPIVIVILAHYLLPDERLNWNRTLGTVLGLSGFAVLFLPTLLKAQIEWSIPGILLSFIGSCCYAIGAIYARKKMQSHIPLTMPTIQLLSALFYLVPLSLIFEKSPLSLVNVPLSAWGCVLGLAISCSMLAFIMYHRIVTKYGATAIAMATYLLPVIGTLLGVTFLHEKMTLNFVLAALFILCGVGVVNGIIPVPSIAKLKRKIDAIDKI